MSAQDWAYLIGAIATALGVRELIPRLGGWLTGSGARRRSEIDRMAAEVTEAHRRRLRADERADAADRRADDEATKRRKIQEYASQLRSAYYETGRTPAAWPEIENTLTPDEVRQLRNEE